MPCSCGSVSRFRSDDSKKEVYNRRFTVVHFAPNTNPHIPAFNLHRDLGYNPSRVRGISDAGTRSDYTTTF